MIVTPAPKSRRPTLNCATLEAVEVTTMPTMVRIAPMNIVMRLPNLSEMVEAAGAETI